MFVAAGFIVFVNVGIFVGSLVLFDDRSRNGVAALIAVVTLGIALLLAKSLRGRLSKAAPTTRRVFAGVLCLAGLPLSIWSFSEARKELAQNGPSLELARAAVAEISRSVNRLEGQLHAEKSRMAAGKSFIDPSYLRSLEIDIAKRREDREHVQRRVYQLEEQPKWLWACMILASVYGLGCLAAGAFYVMSRPHSQAVIQPATEMILAPIQGPQETAPPTGA